MLPIFRTEAFAGTSHIRSDGIWKKHMDFTSRFQRAVEHAGQSLARFNHSQVRSDHLLLGLLMLQKGVVVFVLRKFGFSVEELERRLAPDTPGTEPASTFQGIPCAASAIDALKRAEADAVRFRHPSIGTEHLLLGILAETEGPSANLFSAMKVDPEEIREAIDRELNPR